MPVPGGRAVTRSRHIPSAVAREVWTRDRAQCAFVGAEGRCRERGLLELHHRVPFAPGGPTTVANLELRYHVHNVFEAATLFGEERTGPRGGLGTRAGETAARSGTS